MTYFTLAACPDSGRIGVGIASLSIAAGFSYVHMVGQVGAQVRTGPREARPRCTAMELMALGLSPASALARALDDGAPGAHLMALLSRAGGTAVCTGDDAPAWAGHVSGAGFVCAGTGLAGPATLAAMAEAFTAAPGEALDLRLLRTLEAGAAAGGIAVDGAGMPARSAAIMVHGAGVHSEADLRVDLHTDAVAALRALYDFHKPYEAFYRLRSENPRQTPPQEAFMATLDQPAKEPT